MRSNLIRAAIACGTLSAVMLLGSCSSSSKKDKQAEEDAKMAGDLFNNRGGNLAAPLVKPVNAEFGEAPIQLPPQVALTPAPAPKPANIVDAPAPVESLDTPVVEAKPKTKVSAPKVPSVAVAPKVPSPKAASTYSIQKGDILGKVAQDHGVKTADLLAANPGVDPARLKIGQKINIPAAGYKAPVSTKTSGKTAAGKSTSAKSSGAAKTAKPSSSGDYTVVSGDFPEKIAKKLGVKQADLMAANQGINPTNLKLGQKLKVPGASASSSSHGSEHTGSAKTDPADVGTTPAPVAAGPDHAAAPAPAPAPSVDITGLEKIAYTTAAGDTLESLAAGWASSIELIKAANPSIKSNADLKPNTSITIPVAPR